MLMVQLQMKLRKASQLALQKQIPNPNVKKQLVKYGDKSESVKLLQAHLNTFGFGLTIDGIFGKKSLEALVKWSGEKITEYDVSNLKLDMKLVREQFKDTQTVGKLYLNGVYFCDTLEDKNRDLNKNGIFDGSEKKVYSETCIPFGQYKVIINQSPKFKRLMPRLLNVPHFDGILIHNGVTEKNSAGCILVGSYDGQKLVRSKEIFNKLFEIMKYYNDIQINIV